MLVLELQIVHITQIVPLVVGKKKKLDKRKTQQPNPKGTATNHYLSFLKEALNTMDNFEYMHNPYLAMDNAPIYKRVDIQEMIEKRSYKCIYLILYSPELNLAEQFWSVVKNRLKRHEIIQEETLQDRVRKACNQILQSNFYGFVKHSHSYLEDCLNKKSFKPL